MKLTPKENKIHGHWIKKENKVVADDNCKRIEWLIDNVLIYIERDETGWNRLYKDPEDNRFWELKYLYSGWHGGGPPSLINISKEIAETKYNI